VRVRVIGLEYIFPLSPKKRRTFFIDLPSWFQNLTGSLTGTQAKGALSLAILIIWTVSRERNRRIFEDQVKPVSRLVDDIKEAAKLWVSARAKHLAVLVDRPFSE
jgi:hypothetical protein